MLFFCFLVITKFSLAYKRLNSKLPNYLMNTLIPNGTRNTRATRYCNFNLLCPRKTNKQNKQNFIVSSEEIYRISN